MPALNEWLLIVGGFFLRLVLPAALTTLAAWLLHRLDVRWQAEAMAGAPRRSAGNQTPCWETHACSAARQATCPAYGQTAVPCWQFFRDTHGNLRAACLTCAVLKNAPVAVAG